MAVMALLLVDFIVNVQKDKNFGQLQLLCTDKIIMSSRSGTHSLLLGEWTQRLAIEATGGT